jgi:DMSO/TMAO reductase YedYZ molybdopterin-dependent catalytic subunit
VSEDREIHIDRVRELVAEKGDTVWPGGDDNTANVLGEHRELSELLTEDEATRRMFARSRRGFLVGGASALVGILGWRWMSDETKAVLFRRTFEFNERLSQIFYSPKRLAPEFPPDRITEARTNGLEGLESEIDLDAWRLNVSGLPGGTPELALTLSDIKSLPRTEMTTELRCIEGWSIIVHWAGVRFSDFVAAYAPSVRPQDLPQYVSMVTPDELYFVGWDLPSIMHPQTLLAYEMNGAPLTDEHGAPLRLTSPTKYGIKQIKRIGRIEFTNERPRDFWAQPEYGYDWYSGH